MRDDNHEDLRSNHKWAWTLIDPHEARFTRDGFEVISARLDPELISELKREIDAFVSAYDIEGEQQILRRDHQDRGDLETFLRSATQVHGFLEVEALNEHGALRVPRAQALNKLGHALHDHLPAFQKLARSRATRAAFSAAGFAETEIDQSMVIFKSPHIGGDVRWHQDATYLRTCPSRVLGVWFALEDATRENGCLWMAPGHHHSPLRERYVVDWQTRTGQLETLNTSPWPEDAESIPVEVEAGQIVIFHDHMPHRSSPNHSDSSRVAVTLHGHERSAQWLKENWLHRGDLEPFVI